MILIVKDLILNKNKNKNSKKIKCYLPACINQTFKWLTSCFLNICITVASQNKSFATIIQTTQEPFPNYQTPPLPPPPSHEPKKTFQKRTEKVREKKEGQTSTRL